jgi:hypothetical protein
MEEKEGPEITGRKRVHDGKFIHLDEIYFKSRGKEGVNNLNKYIF